MNVTDNNIKQKQRGIDLMIKPFMYIGFVIMLSFGLVYYLLYSLGCLITKTPNKYKNVIGYIEAVKSIVFHNSPTSPTSDFKKQVKVRETRNAATSYISQPNKKEYTKTEVIKKDTKLKKVKIEKPEKIKVKKEKKPRQKNYFFKRNIGKMNTFFLKNEIRKEKIMDIEKKYPKRRKQKSTYLDKNTKEATKPISNETKKTSFIKNSFANYKFVSISVTLAIVSVIALIGVMATTDVMPVSITSAFANNGATTDPFAELTESVEENVENEPTCIDEPQEVTDLSNTSFDASEEINEVETGEVQKSDNKSAEVISGVIETTEDVIKIGDTNEEVIKIQNALMKLHYMDDDDATDYYGDQTEYAMELFQRQHGLSVDGIAGTSTLAVLYSDEAKAYAVSEGDKGSDIKRMQERLVDLDYLSNSYDANGYFDSDTDTAIKAFQRRNSLSADGVVGHRTKQVLYNSSAKSASSSSDDGGSSDTPVIDGGQDGGSYSSGTGDAIVSKAKAYLGQGIPYVRGGKTTDGFDCSGFVYYVLNKAGISTGYRTSSGWASTSSYSTISSMDDLKKGDICVFSGHVGIYIGDGKMIDCSSSSNGVRTTNIKSSNYWNSSWVCGKRVAS